MSKKSEKICKPDKRGIIPDVLNGHVFGNLSDLGRALGIKPSEPHTPKSMKCRKCGAVMRRVEGTNVYFCDALVKVEDETTGIKSQKVCGHRFIAQVHPTPRSSAPGDKKDPCKGKPASKPMAQEAHATA